MSDNDRSGLPPGTPVYVAEGVCACGARLFSCPDCGDARCLRCDPYDGTEPSCHAD